MEQKIISKIEALKKRQAFWTRRLDESVPMHTVYCYTLRQIHRPLWTNAFSSRIDAWFEQKFSQASHVADYTVQFLLMELESVGNIRLEEGCPANRWCRTLLLFTKTFACRQDPPDGVFVMSPPGSRPVAISCCPASVHQTLRFTASLGLKSIEWSASTTAL